MDGDGKAGRLLRERGRLVLLSTYELGHQPLGLASPAAFLEAAGFQPVLLDTAVDPIDIEILLRAEFVAISVPMHTALRLALDIFRRLRELKPIGGPLVCFYGLYASLNRSHLMSVGVDHVIGGEFEEALVALATAIETGNRHVPATADVVRLQYRVPSRTALPALDRYARLDDGTTTKIAGHVEATRGCLHECRHCPLTPVYQGRFFAIPRGLVMEDVRRLVADGARHITFGDPDFLNGPTHAIRLVEQLHDEFSDVTFDCTIKVEHLLKYAELLPKFRRAGCLFITSAFESVSDEILEHLAKGHTREDEIRALAITEAAGISLRPTWIPFTPWTTLEGFVELLTFAGEHRLIDRVAAVQYTIKLLVPPGSALLELEAMRPHLLDLDAERLTYSWAYTDPRVQELELAVDELVREAVDAGHADEEIYDALVELVKRHWQQPITITPQQRLRTRSPKLTEQWFC